MSFLSTISIQQTQVEIEANESETNRQGPNKLRLSELFDDRPQTSYTMLSLTRENPDKLIP